MKNLHIIPTTQKSKIYFNHNKGFEKYQFSKEPFVNGLTNTSNQNIYISSDGKIKKGDWVLFTLDDISEIVRATTIINKAFDSKNGFGYGLEYCKKIILTTDQDLIKDGVQAINDEFLEWFVKNPSCEGVEMEEVHFRTVKDLNGIVIDHEYTLSPKITNNSIRIIKLL